MATEMTTRTSVETAGELRGVTIAGVGASSGLPFGEVILNIESVTHTFALVGEPLMALHEEWMRYIQRGKQSERVLVSVTLTVLGTERSGQG